MLLYTNVFNNLYINKLRCLDNIPLYTKTSLLRSRWANYIKLFFFKVESGRKIMKILFEDGQIIRWSRAHLQCSEGNKQEEGEEAIFIPNIRKVAGTNDLLRSGHSWLLSNTGVIAGEVCQCVIVSLVKARDILHCLLSVPTLIIANITSGTWHNLFFLLHLIVMLDRP